MLCGAAGTVIGTALDFCDGVKGEGRSAESECGIIIDVNEFRHQLVNCLTCRLLLLRWWMSLQERVVEKHVERHSFFRVTSQQAKEKVLELLRCADGNPKIE